MTITSALVIAGIFTLVPFLAAAFLPGRFSSLAQSLPAWLRFALPAALAIPYLPVTVPAQSFHWQWLTVYLLLPVTIAALLERARTEDPAQRGTWRDLFVLAVVGLAVDLRWFEHAWPPHLAIFNKILLLDAGIYGFLAIRQLDGVGFDLRLRPADLKIGLRELAFYTPIALLLGLALAFLHINPQPRWWLQAAPAFLFTFFFIAVPE